MYVSFIFVAIFIGYSIGSAPIISYNYGSGNNKELQNMSKKSLSLISIWAVGLFVLAQVISTPLATIFVGYDHDLFLLTRHGFRIYCVTFLINGFNIYGSAFFTALSNGLISEPFHFLEHLSSRLQQSLYFLQSLESMEYGLPWQWLNFLHYASQLHSL